MQINNLKSLVAWSRDAQKHYVEERYPADQTNKLMELIILAEQEIEIIGNKVKCPLCGD